LKRCGTRGGHHFPARVDLAVEHGVGIDSADVAGGSLAGDRRPDELGPGRLVAPGLALGDVLQGVRQVSRVRGVVELPAARLRDALQLLAGGAVG
jgi:hypothetical protein